MSTLPVQGIVLPIGGTTGLSHEHTAAIDEAARWGALERQAPAVDEVRHRFGLLVVEACKAACEARQLRQHA